MDRGAWQATVHGVIKSWTRLNDFTMMKESTVFIVRPSRENGQLLLKRPELPDEFQGRVSGKEKRGRGWQGT